MRKVVPAIHAALPVLRSNFLDTKTASLAACFPRETIWELVTLVRIPGSAFPAPLLLDCEAMVL